MRFGREDATGTFVKLATWNLDCARPGAGARSERLRISMAAVGADVWVLTEAHPDLAPGPNHVRAAYSAPAPDRGDGGRWVVIWVREGLATTCLGMPSEPERSAAILLERHGRAPLLVAGTVLPWRGDMRHAHRRGAAAFACSLRAQAADWDRLRAGHPDAPLCVLGDFNQEFDAPGPVGTRIGAATLAEVLGARRLRCVTGGPHDPLLARGWRASIDHVVLGAGLESDGPATIWPQSFPLPRSLSDHHGVSVVVREAPDL